MAKHVVSSIRVLVRENTDSIWTDISDIVTGYSHTPRIGELETVDLELIDRYDLHIRRLGSVARSGCRVPSKDVITVRGVNISDHVSSYSHFSVVGELDAVIIRYQCNPDTLQFSTQPLIGGAL